MSLRRAKPLFVGSKDYPNLIHSFVEDKALDAVRFQKINGLSQYGTRGSAFVAERLAYKAAIEYSTEILESSVSGRKIRQESGMIEDEALKQATNDRFKGWVVADYVLEKLGDNAVFQLRCWLRRNDWFLEK